MERGIPNRILALKRKIDMAIAKGSMESITMTECAELDGWIKSYAILEFKKKMYNVVHEPMLREFLIMMVEHHYGSVEVDNLLVAWVCYPEFPKK